MTAFVRRHPLTTALFVVGVVMAVPLIRVQVVADEAHVAAADAKEAVDGLQSLIANEEAEEDIENEKACELRNTFQRATRRAFTAQYDALEPAFAGDPEAQAVIAELRAAVEAVNPITQDRDCNDDGRLDEEDYAP